MHFILLPLAYLAFNQLCTAQIVSPFATHDCSKQVFYNGDHACKNDLTKCCASSGICCAGGCCPYDAVCIYSGTAQEACCPISDKTQCGAAPPPSTATCPPASAPSVPCSGIRSNWYCRAGCTCNVSVDGGCNCFAGNCVPAGGGSSSSLKPAASSTSTPPAPSKSTTSSSTKSSTTPSASASSASSSSAAAVSASVVGSQTQSSDSSSSLPVGPRTSTQTVQPSSAVSAASSAAAATTTRAASEGTKLELKCLSGLVSNVVAFGIMLLL